MNNKTRTLLLGSIALVAFAAPAMAQEEVTGPNPAADDSASDASRVSNDIVVTASRRAERLQDVPLAVSAIGAEQLSEAGFQNLSDIQYQFSGVQFGSSPNDSGFRLRGVGSAGGFSSSSEQNVGTVVDNVVVPFGNPVNSLGDLERVEILKGPQGTQFGKNASSGVVNITTRRPSLTKASGTLFASYAELNEHDVHGWVSVPLVTDKIAASVYGFHRGHDGYVDNVVLNKKWGATESYGVRGKLLLEPAEGLSVYLIGDWSRLTQVGPGQLWTLNRVPVSASPLVAARFAAVTARGVVPGFYNEKSVEDTDAFQDERNYGGSAEINLELGDYTLTSITAYRRLDAQPTTFGIDALPFPIFSVRDNRVDRSFLSQELRVTSPRGGTVEYVGGIYLSRLKTGLGGFAGSGSAAILRPALPFSSSPQIQANNGITLTQTKSDSAAAFVDGSFRLGERVRLIGGIRVQYDKVNASSSSISDPLYPSGPGPNGFTVPYTTRPLSTGETSRTDWAGRAGIEFKPNPDLLFFGTVARGYLGPTVTFSGLTGAQVQVEPQTVFDVTIGAKTQFFDRRLTLNGNFFYDKYNNMQTSVFNGLEFLTENAGGFEAIGFEVDASFRFSDRLSINGSVTYSKTRFTDYITACPANIREAGAAAIAARCNEPGSTAAQALFQARGEPLSGAPEFSATAGIDFNQPIGESLLLDASVNLYHRSRVQYDVGNPNHSQRAYQIVGGTIGLGAPDGRWRIAAFVRNLFDKKFHSAVIGLPFTDPDGTVNWMTRDGRRTAGVNAQVKF